MRIVYTAKRNLATGHIADVDQAMIVGVADYRPNYRRRGARTVSLDGTVQSNLHAIETFWQVRSDMIAEGQDLEDFEEFLHSVIAGEIFSMDFDATFFLTNGEYDSDLASWTIDLNGSTGGSIAQNAGTALFTQGSNSVWLDLYQAVTLKADVTYTLSANRTAESGSGTSRVGIDAAADVADGVLSEVQLEWLTTATGVKTAAFSVSTPGTYYVHAIDNHGATETANFDDVGVTVREFDAKLEGASWNRQRVSPGAAFHTFAFRIREI